MNDFLICLFTGIFGGHKFIVEKKPMAGFVYLFTFGGFTLAWLYDCIKYYRNIKTGYVDVLKKESGSSITAINGCKSIQGIKSLSKQSMYALQALAIPESKKGSLTAETIVATCDSKITNALYIIDDCKKIISDTANPQVFYDRYDLLIEKYKEISRFEPFVTIYGYQPNESLIYYVDAKSRLEKKMIDRCYNKALIKADSMKTEKGQMNQFIKANESLKAYEFRMSPENISYMNDKFKKKILSENISVLNENIKKGGNKYGG